MVELVIPVTRHVDPVFHVAVGIPCPELAGCASSYVLPLLHVMDPELKYIYA